MKQTSDYRRAYEAAKQELSDLLALQEQIGKRLLVVRQSIQTLATLCENEGVEVEPSDEAAYLLDNSSLADEIRRVLGAANYDKAFRPSEMKDEVEKLGHDLSQYQNPQATIHMVLKRMAESRDVREQKDAEGKTVYLMRHPLANLETHPIFSMRRRRTIEQLAAGRPNLQTTIVALEAREKNRKK